MTNNDIKYLIDLVVKYSMALDKEQGDLIKHLINGDNVEFCDVIETNGLLTCSALILEQGLYVTWNVTAPERFVVYPSSRRIDDNYTFAHKYTLTEWCLRALEAALKENV